MNNERVRGAAKSVGIPLWMLAQELGICEMTLTRRLRNPLDARTEEDYISIINRLAQNRNERMGLNGNN